jgi:Ser/Thr protein kinase RdoA (MazF antagonist)
VRVPGRDGQREVADDRASSNRGAVSRAGPEVIDSVDARGVEDMTEIARLAAGRYGISPGCGLHQYPLTENWTFRIEPDAAPPVVLRIYRPGGRSPAEIHSELAWMSALRQDSPALLPDVIPTGSGGTVLAVVREPLDPCYCVLFSCAPGHEPEPDQLAAWFPQLGAITARLHRHARAWAVPAWFRRPRWDLATTLGDRPHWGSWQASVTDAEERRQTRRLANVIMARLSEFGDGAGRFGLVHADLRLSNLLVDGERITVIDFEDCGFSWYLYDLACALTFNEGRPDVRELIEAWVAGYREVQPLSRADEQEIDTFLMLRRLMLSAYAGLRPDTDLAEQMRTDGYSGETCALAEPYLSRFG